MHAVGSIVLFLALIEATLSHYAHNFRFCCILIGVIVVISKNKKGNM